MKILFLILDLFSFIASVFIGIIIRTGEIDYNFIISNLFVLLPSFCLSVFLLWLFSFYEFKYIHKNFLNYKTISFVCIINFLFSAGIIYFTSTIFNTSTPKTNLLIVSIIYFIFVFLFRKIYFYIRLNIQKNNIVILGNNHTIDVIIEEISKYLNYKIFINSKVVNDEIIKNIIENVDKISTIIISSELLNTEQKWQQDFLLKGVIVQREIDYFEEIFSRVPRVALNNNIWLLEYISSRNISIISKQMLLKRLFDFICSLILFPFCFILGTIIFFVILIVDRQFPLFVQERIGLKGKHIFIYKFRTMITGTETVTKVGKILRKFRLDEFPQIINILVGDTSFVGPRPLWEEEYKYLNKYITNHPLRTIIRPGITGWAQLNYKAPIVYCIKEKPNDISNNIYFRDAEKRLAYDLWYIKNASLSLDIEIILKTLKRMFVNDKKIVK